MTMIDNAVALSQPATTAPCSDPDNLAGQFAALADGVPQAVHTGVRKFLHVGCGPDNPARLPACFRQAGWSEVRLDIDPGVSPDIVASMTDMHVIPDACMDAVWSSHNLEHLHSFEVPIALAEMIRVLKADGFLLLNLPDLRAIAKSILADNLTNPLYVAECGIITSLDVLFGHQQSLQSGRSHMAHRTGFTSTTLGQALIHAGFEEVRVHEGRHWDLWALALMPQASPALMNELAGVMQ